MKKRLCVLFLAVLMVFPLSGCMLLTYTAASFAYSAIASDEQEYAAVLNVNWGITLPSGFELIFYESEEHPRGEGSRYCVLEYEDASVLDTFREWTEETGPTTYCDSYPELAEETIAFFSVPEDYRPNYENAVWWYCHAVDVDTRDELLMLWDGDRLYIIEGFY